MSHQHLQNIFMLTGKLGLKALSWFAGSPKERRGFARKEGKLTLSQKWHKLSRVFSSSQYCSAWDRNSDKSDLNVDAIMWNTSVSRSFGSWMLSASFSNIIAWSLCSCKTHRTQIHQGWTPVGRKNIMISCFCLVLFYKIELDWETGINDYVNFREDSG